jgi:hypothetical protein
MAVLHVNYKPKTGTDNAAYEDFCNIFKSYSSVKVVQIQLGYQDR